jgi:hypothetical protein
LCRAWHFGLTAFFCNGSGSLKFLQLSFKSGSSPKPRFNGQVEAAIGNLMQNIVPTNAFGLIPLIILHEIFHSPRSKAGLNVGTPVLKASLCCVAWKQTRVKKEAGFQRFKLKE